MTPDPDWRSTLDEPDRRRVRALAEQVETADGVAALSEPTLLDLSGAARSDGTRHLLLADPDGADDPDRPLAAYAHVDASDPQDRVVELAVAPAARRRGVGGRLVAAVAAELGDGPARAWAHGDLPGAAALAAREGLRRERELWMMRRDPDAGPLPDRAPPEGVTIAGLRPGVDEADVVAVNARAFAWHPEQGSMTVDDVMVRENEDWFDAAGFLLARDTDSGALLGFHWTKVHPAAPAQAEALGEVYVVGVDPDAQGRGLGGALTRAGLLHLTGPPPAGRGLGSVVLYVEGDNDPAVATYTGLGFVRVAVDVSYAR